MKRVSVKVEADHLERLAKQGSPVLAIAELIWNSVDADATDVRVVFNLSKLEIVDRIRVIDNGHGIAFSEVEEAFGNLGGSWKKRLDKSKTRRRLLHGKAGKGRFRAFSLGNIVEWHTVFHEGEESLGYTVTGNANNLKTFEVEDPTAVENGYTGTKVVISDVRDRLGILLSSPAVSTITETFALYMRAYPEVKIWYNAVRIDPESIEDLVTDYDLGNIELEHGRSCSANLTVIEWKTEMERSLYFCDANGFTLQKTSPGIRAPRFHFTAYIKSEALREFDEQNALILDQMHPDVVRIIDKTKEKLREHFRQRTAEEAVDLVEQWKQEAVYPYEGEPKSILEKTEREVFDVCALSISSYLPDFEISHTKNRRFAFRLLKEALVDSPEALQRIFTDVLELPKEKQEELAKLLEKTTLTAIINASKTVADRLDFLRGLEILVFDPESKEQLLERRQLHRILANETWIFGEEFNLTLDDQSLTEVLRMHLSKLGRDPKDVQPVLRENGTEGIVDLMLSRCVPQPKADDRQHLVIELKRPTKPIDDVVEQQIRSYAFAVASDERFHDTSTTWIFWAISNKLSDSVQKLSRQRNRPEGLVYDDPEGRIFIWVRTWGQLIKTCRARLEFFQKHLKYSPDVESALGYLRETHEKYLPESVRK